MNGNGKSKCLGGAVGAGMIITSIDCVYAIDALDIIGWMGDVDLNLITNSGVKTSQELKENEILSKLGSGFKKDTGINGGYPILVWQ